jgi:hypothetical protein
LIAASPRRTATDSFGPLTVPGSGAAAGLGVDGRFAANTRHSPSRSDRRECNSKRSLSARCQDRTRLRLRGFARGWGITDPGRARRQPAQLKEGNLKLGLKRSWTGSPLQFWHHRSGARILAGLGTGFAVFCSGCHWLASWRLAGPACRRGGGCAGSAELVWHPALHGPGKRYHQWVATVITRMATPFKPRPTRIMVA